MLFFDDRIYNQDKTDIFYATVKNKTLNKHIWYFVRDNWDQIYSVLLSSQFGVSSLFESMGRLVDNPDHKIIDDIKSFNKFDQLPHLRNYIDVLVDKITLNTNFNKHISVAVVQ